MKQKIKAFLLTFALAQLLFLYALPANAQVTITPYGCTGDNKACTDGNGPEATIRKYLCVPTTGGPNPKFFASNTGTVGTDTNKQLTINASNNAAQGDLYKCINRIYRFAIVLTAVGGVTMIVIAGYLYMSADGNGETIEKAKGMLISSIAAMVILMVGYIFLRALNPDLIKFQAIQPPSVALAPADKPSTSTVVTLFNPDGTVKTVAGGAGHQASEIQGCTFQTGQSDIPNLTEPMFMILKNICYNLGVKLSPPQKPPVSSVVGSGHAQNSYHYKGCAIDFAANDNNFYNSTIGQLIIKEAKSQGISDSRINPGTDQDKKNHIHIDLGSSCPSGEIKDSNESN